MPAHDSVFILKEINQLPFAQDQVQHVEKLLHFVLKSLTSIENPPRNTSPAETENPDKNIIVTDESSSLQLIKE